jgi:hypothetical protein
VCSRELVLDHGKPHRIFTEKKQVCVIGSLIADLVTHAPVSYIFDFGNGKPYVVMRQTELVRIVESKQPLP